MADAPVQLVQRRFGETMRRDAWWVQPAVVFLVLSSFIVYATWAAFQGDHYSLRARTSRRSTRRSSAATRRTRWFGPKPAWWPVVAAVLAGPAHPAGPGRLPGHLLLLPRRLLQGVLGRPARLRGRRAAQELLGRGLVPAHPAERPPLLPVRRAALPAWSWPTTSGRRCGSPIRPPDRSSFGVGVGTLVLAVNVVLLGGYTLGCHSLRHLVGGCLDRLLGPPGAPAGLRLRRAASTAAT